MSTTQEYTGTLVAVSCGECGVTFGLDEGFQTARRRDHKTFWCPNGHGRAYRGESDIERAERLRREAVAREDDAWTAYSASQDQLRASQRSKAALKGQLTRIRNKVAAGICPVGGCRRHFDNVQAHIATQHPTWHVIDPETGKEAVL